MKTLVIKLITENQWSPEQIAGYCKDKEILMVGKTRIYEFIHEDLKNGGDLYIYIHHQLKHRNRKLYSSRENNR